MKKVILCAAALMFGTMAFAQVSGAPTASAVPALPGAASGANTGESIQNGNDNKVRVRQAGTSQSVYTNQNDGSGSGGNLARVMQTGLVNPTSGIENLAEVLQSGSANQSTTVQEGDYNNAVTRQGQNDDSSADNRAKIRQGTGQQAENNFAAIEQDGNSNLAQTQQTYDNSEAWTVQDGDGNKSMIVQNAGPNGTDGHLAQNEQVGNNNESSIDQSGAGARNTARTFQEGDDNKAKQLQTTDAVAGGTGNTAIIAQGNVFTGFTFASTYFDLQNVDDIDSGSQSLGSIGGIAFQTQSGHENNADIRQFGVDSPEGNYAEQNQSGSGNEAFTVQNLYGNPAGAANYARQDQSGTNSQAGISQRGFNHKAYQRQSGDDNSALTTQQGDSNLVNTYQDGDGNRGTTAQRGQDNGILLVQRGGHSYSVTQNLPNGSPVGLPNGGNQADILQLGPNGDFGTDGVDCVFDDPMDPTMDYSVPGFNLGDVCPDC
tara:strand:+ start:11725 stop:13188 length:1464 start_codon:yes stop_codon:yes gene_type:complete